jgi:hypothetical protein
VTTSTYFDNHPGAPKVLHRLVCGRTADRSGRELLEFAVRGWPKRCNDDLDLSQAVDELSEISE